jgi:hypothetical protein
VPQARDAGIAHYIDQQLSVPPHESLLQAQIFNFRPPFADFYRTAIVTIDDKSRKMFGRDFALLSAVDQHDFVDRMRQNKIEGWTGRQARRFMPCFAPMQSTSSGERWKVTKRASPICRIFHRNRGGEMASEKVDIVIIGAGASGSIYASVLAKAGKKVVLLDSGPDWQLADLISSEIWGRRVKPAAASDPSRGKNPMAYAAQGGWGATSFVNSRGPLPAPPKSLRGYVEDPTPKSRRCISSLTFRGCYRLISE